MATTDAGLSSLALATYSNSTYYSTYFGGSSDYLSIPTNAAFQFGTGNFTIEAWVYLISGTTGTIFDNRTVSVSTNPVFYISNATTVSYYVAGTGVITSGSVTLTGNWNHLALSRVSGSTKMFINGVQSGSTYTDTNNYSTSGAVLIGAGLSAANSLVGYISNLRVLKGTGLYTANFNSPNIQLTAIANTSLLTCNTNSFVDSSVNNFTITKTGNIGFRQFTPTLQVTSSATLTPTFTTGTLTYNISVPSNINAISVTPIAVDPALATIKFNGNVTLTSGQANIAAAGPYLTNGYSENFVSGMLQYANAAPVNVVGYSWTAELWVYFTGTYTSAVTLFSKRASGLAASAYHAYLKVTSGYLAFYNGTTEYISTTNIPLSTWCHVAYTYDGSAISIYLNGRKIYGSVVTLTDNTDPLTIGGIRGYTEWMIGNISNFRFVKGYVIYTQNFTPSTSPLDLTQSASTGIRAITGAPTNGNSVFFNGTSDYLTVPGAGGQFAFGTGNFTVEGWFYSNSLTSDRVIYSIQNSWSVRVTTTGFLVWFIAGLNAGTSSVAVTTGTWNHFAVVRSGTGTNQFVMYLNGAPVYTNSRTDNISSTNNLYIGELDAGNSNYFAGYLSNLRILKGTALYTSLFAPSVTPLTNITNTSLLALQTTITADASTNNFTLTASGAPRLATNISPFNTAGAASTQFLSTSLAYQTISNPYSPALSLGQGHNNFTAEAWVYLTATPPVAPGWYIMQKGVNSTPGLEWSFSITSTGLYFQTASGIPTGTTTSTAFTANIISGQWMHLALTKVGTSVNVWFNGFYIGTVNGVNNLLYNANVASYITIANTQTGATTAFAGFINNARVVYGKALYTVNYDVPFTPSTTPLSVTQSATATVASIDNASSYVNVNGSSVVFNNTNDFLTFPEPANLFNSIQLNGSTQSLTVPSNAAFTFGTGDFTIEFYFNGPSQINTFFYDNRGGAASGYPHISTGSSTSVLRWGPTNTSGSIIIGNNQWHHCAVTRQSGTIKLWVDGVLDGSGSDTTDYNTNYAVLIGTNSFTGNFLTGNLSNYRVIKGTALYTANFTPSTIPLTKTSQGATASQVSLLTLQNYTIIDNSNNAFTITNNGTVTTSQFQPFQLYGTGQDVTIEAWILLSVAPTIRGWIVNNSATSTGYFGVAIDSTRTISVWSDSNVTAVLTSSRQFPIGIWTHIAVTYVNGIIYTYINGVLDVTVAKTTIWGPTTLGTVYVGRQASAAAQYFPGYITNLRMIYGTAVYTSKFTVPTSPLTAITNTVFLGLQSSVTLDSSTNNAIITRGSGATGLILSPLTSPFATYLPTVTDGGSFGFGWLAGASPTDFVQVGTGYILGSAVTADFTVEAWFYMTVLPASTATIIETQGGYGDTGFAWWINNTGLMVFFGNNAVALTGTVTLSINTWYHLAVTRKNGVLIFWVNGIQNVSVANTFEYGKVSNNISVGRNSAPHYWSGYLSNVRFIIGTAIYTGTFTPSVTPYSLTTSSSTNTLAVSGITTYPAVANPTGTTYSGSIYFTGTSTTGAIYTPYQGRYDLATFDFTIEAWFYWVNNTVNTISIASLRATTATLSNYAWDLRLNTTNVAFTAYTNNLGAVNTEFTVTSSTVSFSVLQWNHVAVVRIGNTLTIYLNGTSIGTGTFTSGQYLNCGDSATSLAVGATTNSVTTSYSNNFRGYISNLRVIKGYGIYTGNFTPPTTTLSNTQNSGTNVIALNNAIPSLGNSVFFNGANDYMRAPSNVTAMGNGDFTIEVYYYPTSFAAVTTLFGQYTAATTALGYWNVQVTTAGIITVYYNGSTNFTASTRILTNEWVHIALVRISGTITLYVNGVSYGTVSFATQFGLANVTSPLFIGATQLSGPTQYAVGYMSNLRIVNGVGVYTGVFTVPASPLSSTQSSGTNITAITGVSTSLLLYQDSLFTDNSTFNDPITGFGNPQYSPVFSPSFFSYPTPADANSGYFNGTSSFLSLTQPSNASTNDFTIEMWVYPTTTAVINNSYLLSTSTTTTNCYHLWIDNATGAVTLAVDSATASITSAAPLLAKANAWTHIAITRTSGVVYLFVNGRRQSTTLSKATQFGDTGILNIGRYQPSPGQYFTGYITNVRFVYGTPAVYTGTYSAPNISTPLSAITNTTLLLLQTTLTKDNSTNNVTITNTGVILSTYTNPYTMMKMPVLLTGQNSRDVTSLTGIRDNSMHSSVMTSVALLSQNYMAAVSPFGITPTILVGQRALNRDNSINNYPITLFTSATFMPYVTPFSGNAIAFNGSTQYITGNNLYNSLGGDFTIEFFMMAPPQTATVGALIIGKNAVYTTDSSNYYIMCSNIGQSGNNIKIYNYTLNSVAPIYSSSISVCDSKWHHVAIVRINNIVKVYIDGVLDSSPTNSFTNTGVWDYSNYTIGSAPTVSGFTVANLAYNGMLSNMRIINSLGIYTGTFTPPTNNLTTSQTGGSNIVAYTPTVPSTTGYSWIFNSVASSYVQLTPAPTLNFGFNDYTVELWHYLTGRPSTSTNPCIFSNYNSFTTGALSMFAGHNSSVTTKYQIAFNGLSFPTNALVSNTSIIYGKWTHIAVVRRSGIVYLYINGILDSSSGLGNYNVYSNNNTWYIGATGDNPAVSFISGLISNFRAVNGIGLYSGTSTGAANFTVPAAALSITQSSSSNIAAISTSLVANGGAVWYSGQGSAGMQYLNTITQNLTLNGTLNNVTVEAWVYLYIMPTTNSWASGVSTLFGIGPTLSTGTYFVIGLNNLFLIRANTLYGGFTHNMIASTWYHLAYVISNNTITFYVNGISIGSTINIPSIIATSNNRPEIATAAGTAGYGLNGYISNLRVVKALAVYTGNFTPSTSPLTNTQSAVININAITGTSTSLLALQDAVTADSSTNAFTLTAGGSPSLNSLTFPSFISTNGYSAFMQPSLVAAQNSSLTVPITASIAGTGTFTAECWIYPFIFTSGYQVIIGNDTSNGLTIFGINSNGTIFYGTAPASGQGTTTGYPIVFSAWNHIALVRNGNSTIITLYVNGAIGFTGTNTTNYTAGIIRIGTDLGGGTFPFTGYISNIRIVNGVAVYTTNFTPPTAYLTTTQTANSNGSPSSALATNTYAGSFNGSNQYLTLPNPNQFIFGNNNFTIEFWMYPFTASQANMLVDFRPASVNGTYPCIYLSGGAITYYVNSADRISGSIPSIYIWTHIALVRNSGITTIYFNGVSTGSPYTDSVTYLVGTTSPVIGASGFSRGTSIFNGYISNLRIVNGSALYTGTFTVPTAQLASTQSSSTNIGAIVAPTTSNGYYSNYFTNSVGQYLSLPGAPFVFGTSAFTVECWVYPLSLSTTQTFVDNWVNTTFVTGQWTLYMNATTGFVTFAYATGTATQTTITTTISIPTGRWTHVAAVRTNTSANGFALYVHGLLAQTATLSASIGTNTTSSIGILTSNKTNPMNGFISNVRLTNGVAVYTGIFLPQSSPLTATQSSVSAVQSNLLALQNSTTTDASTNAFTLTAVGNPIRTIFSPFPVTNGSSVFFNGSAYETIPASQAYNFNNTDFTIELWVYATNITTTNFLFANNTSNNDTGFQIQITNSQLRYGGNISFTSVDASSLLNVWTHIAWVRINGVETLYINGSAVSTVTRLLTYSQGATNLLYIGYHPVQGGFFNGYLSNFRIQKGLGVYTGNFTPSLTPLTLTQTSGTNISAITGTVPANGSSVGFASSAYLSTAGNSQLAFGDIQFTIEFWMYVTSATVAQTFYDLRGATASNVASYIWMNTNGTINYGVGSTTTVITSSTTVVANIWYHVAVVRTNQSGSGVAMYINGVPSGTGTDANTHSQFGLRIGQTGQSTQPLTGNISNFRILTSVVLYSSNFVPSVTPLTAITNTKILVLQNSTTADASANNFTLTATGTPTLSTTISPFIYTTQLLLLQNSTTADASANALTATVSGTVTLFPIFSPFVYSTGYSVYFNGNNQYINAPSNTSFAFGTGDFTIEGWIYLTTNTSNGTLYDSRTSTNSVSPRIYIDLNKLYYAVGNTNVIIGITINSATWYHIAVVRNSGYTTMYVNGVQTSNIYTDTNNYVIGDPDIGTGYGNSNSLNGYITNLRIVKGLAVYNNNFVVPVIPLIATVDGNIAAVTGTSVSLLTSQSSTIVDNSTFAVVITNVGTVVTTPVINLYNTNKGITELLTLQNTTIIDNSFNNFTITNTGTTLTYPAPGLFNTALVHLLALQSSLTIDRGYYALTLTSVGKTQLDTESPFAPTNGKSVYFNGANQYLTAPSNAVFTFGTGDFTIEGWIYLTGATTTGTLYDSRTGATTISPQVYINNNIVYYAVAGTNVITGSTITAATWYHIAVVRVSGVTKLYVNGTLSGNSYTDTNNYVIGEPDIGQGYGSSYPLTGYISNVRVVKGTGVYVYNFTVPTTPLTSTQSSVASTQALVAVPSSGYYSGYFDGVSGYLSFPNTNVGAISGNAFTAEAWVFFNNYSTGTGAYNIALFSTINATNNAGFLLNFTGTAASIFGLNFYAWSTPSNINTTFNYNFSLGTWYHVAVTKTSAGVITMYINGTSIGSFTNTQTWTDNTTYYIGYNGQASFPYYFPGFISNFRLTLGQPTYINNFTPSTTSLTATQSANINGTPSLAIAQSTSTGYYNLVFAGSTAQYLGLPSVGYVFGTNPFTVECWVYATSFTASQLIVDNFTSATSGQYVIGQWQIFLTITTGRVNFQYATSASALTTVTTTIAVPLTSWTHIAIVRTNTSAGGFGIYINGVLGVVATLSASVGVINTSGIGIQYQTKTAPFFGYITNIRFTYGVALYSNLFIPQITPLTTTQTAQTPVASTLLALQNSTTTDASLNNLTLAATGSPTVSSTVIPYMPVTNGYSVYFNGSSYVAATTQTGFGLGTGDFTIEVWVYLTSTAGNTIADFRTGITATATALVISNRQLLFYDGPANNNITLGTATVTLNQWSHIAYVRASNIVTGYINGVASGSATVTSNLGTTQPIMIGNNQTAGNNFNGYMSNFRVVKGLAVYTGAFTPPTSPLETTQSSGTNITAISAAVAGTSGTQLLMFQNSITVDSSVNNVTSTVTLSGNPVLNTTVMAYMPFINSNGRSVFFTGSAQYINAPSNAVFTFGTSDFTIEGYIYLASGTSGTLYDSRTGATTLSPQIYIASNVVYYAVGGTVAITGISINAATWYHIAVVRISGSTKLYVNGLQYGSTYTDSNNYEIGSPFIGTGYASSNPLNGYISNLRVINGTGLYTSAFTVPTTTLTANAVSSVITNLAAPTTSNGYYATAHSGLTGQYLSVPGTPFIFGANAFTVECWVFINSLAAQQTLIDNYVTGGSGSFTPSQWQLYITTSGTVAFNYAVNPSTVLTPTTTTTVSIGVWTHIAAVRTSTSTNGFAIYINGVAGVTGTVTLALGVNVTSSIGIQTYTKTLPMTGMISNIRFTNLAVYTGAFTPPTGPLAVTQSSGTNIAAITGTSVLLLTVQSSTIVDNSTFAVTITNVGAVVPAVAFGLFNNTGVSLLTAQNATFIDNSVNGVTITNSPTPVTTAQVYGLFGASVSKLLALQTTLTGDASVNNITLTATGNAYLEKSFSAFGNTAPVLLTAQSGIATDNSTSSQGINTYTANTSVLYQTTVTPYGYQTPTALLTAQSNVLISDATGFYNSTLMTNQGTTIPVNTTTGPFNNDTSLLTFQGTLIIDYSNNSARMTTVGAGVAPTDANPFTANKSLTSLLIPYGYNDISIANTYIANNANIAQTNFVYNPFTIPSSLVSVLGLQTSNITLESSINNSTFVTANTAPTSNAFSPFGTYYANGILVLNTNSTTGVYGADTINYANLLVIAGDTVTTNAYSITVTSLNNVGNIGNRNVSDFGIAATLANANLAITDVANSNITDSTILTFNVTNTTLLNGDMGYSMAPSNATFFISDVANSNINETLSSVFVSGVKTTIVNSDTGLYSVAPSNATFFISDVANSNISETIANVVVSNVSTSRSIQDTGTQPTPSPVGGTVLFPTYAYTDGVTITAANVQGGGSGGSSTASNQQIWYQT